MYDAKRIKRMVLEQEICVNEQLEERIMNDEVTIRDIAFINYTLQEKNRIEKLISSGELNLLDGGEER